MKSYRRIAIFGPTGAGKTTLALKLSQKLDLNCYHLDKYFFKENWEPREKTEFQKKKMGNQSTSKYCHPCNNLALTTGQSPGIGIIGTGNTFRI